MLINETNPMAAVICLSCLWCIERFDVTPVALQWREWLSSETDVTALNIPDDTKTCFKIDLSASYTTLMRKAGKTQSH